MKNNTELSVLLVEKGADVNTNYCDGTGLMHAAYNNNTDICILLIENRASIVLPLIVLVLRCKFNAASSLLHAVVAANKVVLMFILVAVAAEIYYDVKVYDVKVVSKSIIVAVTAAIYCDIARMFKKP